MTIIISIYSCILALAIWQHTQGDPIDAQVDAQIGAYVDA